jgi:hypothetical protein
MSLEKQKATLKKIGLIYGIINIFSIGFVNSVYSDARWPTSSGTQFIIDMFFVSFSNPYALFSGVLIYLFFYRLADKLEETRSGKNDVVWILLAIFYIILMLILAKGILVY